MKDKAIKEIRNNIEDFKEKYYLEDLNSIYSETKGMNDILERIHLITNEEYYDLQSEIVTAYVDAKIEIEREED